MDTVTRNASLNSGAPVITGRVAELWRYPVKSMAGERVASAPVGMRGLAGDRAYAVLDSATGHIASAKHPRKWGRLLACRASYPEPPQPDAPMSPVRILFPDGTSIRSDNPEVDRVLSSYLGREVALVAVPPAAAVRQADRRPVDAPAEDEDIREEPLAAAAPGTFFDYGPVHLLTEATLARLRELYREGVFDHRRFRPNILMDVDGVESGFVENEWSGRILRFGSGCSLGIIDPTPRCLVTTLAQGDLPHDPGILRTVARHSSAVSGTAAPGILFPATAGVYAVAERGGIIKTGESVAVSGNGARHAD